MTKYTRFGSNFGADGPFFRIIRKGLEGLADGEDYFDLLADDVVIEYVVSVPGYPRRVEGRQGVIDLYSGYDDYMTVHTAGNLRVYRDPQASVAVLEYEVHGESVQTGRPYHNRFVSIITVKDHKVTHCLAQLVGDPHRTPPWMLPPHLAYRSLNISADLVRAGLRATGPVGQGTQAAFGIAADPRRHALPRHPEPGRAGRLARKALP